MSRDSAAPEPYKEEKSARRPMDESYKRFFSQVPMVRDLLEGFVSGEWLRRVDLSTLAPMPASFVTDLSQQRHCDVVWKVKWRETDEWVFLYLLIEFQSRATRLMPARMMVYEGLLLLALAKLPEYNREDELLPAILPICLYNGESRWQKPVRLSKTRHSLPRELSHLETDGSFLLIDMNDFEEEELAAMDNLAAALFRLETSRTTGSAKLGLGALNVALAKVQDPEIEKSFDTWLVQVLQQKFPGLDLNEARGRKGKTMLAQRLDKWELDAQRKGRREGRQELLIELLGSRFGPISEEVRNRIFAITSADKLTQIANRLFQVNSLDELMEDV